jgi:NADH-quinone oxidoreductase subunit J
MSAPAFIAVAAAATLLALVVVLARNLLVAAVCLMGHLAVTAAAYVLLGASLLAGMQVLVYVAGTVVVIVFAIMLTQSDEIDEPAPSRARRAVAACASAGFIAVAIAALSSGQLALSEPAAPPIADDARAIGALLLSSGPEGYVLPLEVVSLLLLVVLIGGIALAGAGARRREEEADRGAAAARAAAARAPAAAERSEEAGSPEAPAPEGRVPEEAAA